MHLGQWTTSFGSVMQMMEMCNIPINCIVVDQRQMFRGF